jgi:hypothetical protein
MINSSTERPRHIDVFVHVPKTAGTSLRSVVIDHYGAESTFVLHDRTNLLSPTRTAEDYASPHAHDRSLQRKVAERVLYSLPAAVHTAALKTRNKLAHQPSQADMYNRALAILGHFSLTQFDEHNAGQRPARIYTMVRDPLARMESHYNYGVQMLAKRQPLTGWAEGQDFSQVFEDFALSQRVLNFQSQYTGTEPYKYDAIGTSERADSFVRSLGLLDDLVEMPHFNRTNSAFSPSKRYSEAFIDEFRSAHSLDYEFYAAAEQRQSVLVTDNKG